MESSPGTVENCRSNGVATEAAMVSGLAPGSEACTWSVGKSMLGRSLTGSERYPAIPNSRIAIITKAVITGRLMNKAVRFMAYISRDRKKYTNLILSSTRRPVPPPNGRGQMWGGPPGPQADVPVGLLGVKQWKFMALTAGEKIGHYEILAPIG